MQPLVLGVVALVVIGAAAGAVGVLLSPRGRRPAPSSAILLGVVLAFAGGFLGYLLGAKGTGAFLTAPAWAGAVGGGVLAVAVLLLTRLRRRA